MPPKIKRPPQDAYAQTFVLTQSTLRALTSIAIAVNKGVGAGFMLSGPFGSGKTHLLMTIRELSVTQGTAPWLEPEDEPPTDLDSRQTWFMGEVFRTRRIAPCYVSLGGTAKALPMALQEAVTEQLPGIFPTDVDLFASLDVVDAGLLANNYDCLVVMADELGSNLAGKNSADAAQDMHFLQSVGESLGGHRIVLVLATQRHLGILEHMPYAETRTIQDRYEPLSLHVDGELATRYATRIEKGDLVITGPVTYADRLALAIEIYERYASRQRNDEWARTGLGRATDLLAGLEKLRQRAAQAMAAHEYAEAEPLYRELVAKDPSNIEASKELEKASRIRRLVEESRNSLEQGDYVSACQMLREAVRLAPLNERLKEDFEGALEASLHMLLDKVRLAGSKGDHAAASRAYLEICRLDPRHGRLGVLADRIRRPAEEVLQDLAQELTAGASELDDGAEVVQLLAEVVQEDPSIAKVLPPEYSELLDEHRPDTDCCFILASPPTAEESEGPAEPARRLAALLLECLDQSDLSYYLESKGIVGRTLESQALELCVAEDPLQILSDSCGIAELRRLIEDLGLDPDPNATPEQSREAILRALGFSIPRKPTGINTHREVLARLRSTLRLQNQRATIIGIGLEACDDVAERVLKDLAHFYCTALMGAEYEQVLREKELLPGQARQSIDSLTFGQKIGLFESLNGYLKRDQEAKDRMRKWFERGWIISNRSHVQKNLNLVSPRRNHLAHSEGIHTPILKREASEALALLDKLFEDFEEQRIYPPVIAVTAIQVDSYGRRTYQCVDDRGRPERVFTELDLLVGQEYFFYPVTNPIRVDPLIIPKA